MAFIQATKAWQTTYPGAVIGILALTGVDNTQTSQAFTQQKRAAEAHLRAVFASCSRQDILKDPIMAAYHAYYRHFNKTYHVLLQVESIVFKNKPLPDVLPLVDAAFLAEVSTFLLTASHDMDKLGSPLIMDVVQNGENFRSMSGKWQNLCAGDMVMRDPETPCCSILYGQDDRSPVSASTKNVLYVTYAPTGAPALAVGEHMNQIEHNVRLFAPHALVEFRSLLTA